MAKPTMAWYDTFDGQWLLSLVLGIERKMQQQDVSTNGAEITLPQRLYDRLCLPDGLVIHGLAIKRGPPVHLTRRDKTCADGE